MSEAIEERIDWTKMHGLVPAVVQDADSLQVLMLGYVNREALEATRSSGRVTFYSRSKQRLWQKGESSGNVLQLVSMQLDCDGDALLIVARPNGPTCHRETTSCFGEESAPGLGFLARLERIIEDRATSGDGESYTKRLLDAGVRRIAQKVGEEGVEVALAGTSGSDEELHGEAADLLYHLLVMLRARSARLPEVVELLRRRHEQSG